MTHLQTNAHHDFNMALVRTSPASFSPFDTFDQTRQQQRCPTSQLRAQQPAQPYSSLVALSAWSGQPQPLELSAAPLQPQPALAPSAGAVQTTAAELIPLPEGGFVVDTPGLRGFGLWDLQPRDVSGLFRELADLRCRFRDCLHREEPGCAIPAAVAEGVVDEERFDSYLRLVEELLREGSDRQTTRRR